MKQLLHQLLSDALKNQVSDIHITLQNNKLQIHYRKLDGMQEVMKKYDNTLLEYLKYISNLDISAKLNAQSGSFTWILNNKEYFFRFSYINHLSIQSGVIRILNNHPQLFLTDLTSDKTVLKTFKSWCKKRVGFVLISGPTSSGKTTTLHVLLEEIAKHNKLKIITLEDPIEIYSENYLQIQVNEKANFTYAEGIKQLLRQDPDVIVIGEIRDEYTAKMAFRAALSGHMVFATIHAKQASETIKRFIEFGISAHEIKNTLTGISNQRLFKKKGKKEKFCVYEIIDEQEICEILDGKQRKTSIYNVIETYYKKGMIKKDDLEKEVKI